MRASTIAISFAIFGLLTSSIWAAESRTWTDSSGKTITGELEEITDDGKVKIQSNGQTFTIPIERFSEADQDYIDSQKDRMEKEDETPTRRRRKSDLFDYRQWKDKDDNEIKAKYVRIFEGQVVLLQGRTAHKVSFYDLSHEDQLYLRGELQDRGEDGQIPPPSSSAMSGGGGEMSGGGYQPDVPPPYAPPASMADFAKQQQEEHEKMRREIAKKEEENRRALEEQKRQYAEALKKREEDQIRQQQEYEQEVIAKAEQRNKAMSEQIARTSESLSSPDFNTNFPDINGMTCSNCSKTMGPGIGAGDKCPHCGIFIAQEIDQFGNVTKSVPVPWYYRGGIWNGAMLGGIVGAVVGVIKWIMKKAG